METSLLPSSISGQSAGKMVTDFVAGPVAIGWEGNGFKLKEGLFRLDGRNFFQ